MTCALLLYEIGRDLIDLSVRAAWPYWFASSIFLVLVYA
jgi:hypothetical protein